MLSDLRKKTKKPRRSAGSSIRAVGGGTRPGSCAPGRPREPRRAGHGPSHRPQAGHAITRPRARAPGPPSKRGLEHQGCGRWSEAGELRVLINLVNLGAQVTGRATVHRPARDLPNPRSSAPSVYLPIAHSNVADSRQLSITKYRRNRFPECYLRPTLSEAWQSLVRIARVSPPRQQGSS